VFGVEHDGTLIAWIAFPMVIALDRRAAPLPEFDRAVGAGRAVVVGDDGGLLHFLSREDGSALTRASTDGSRPSWLHRCWREIHCWS